MASVLTQPTPKLGDLVHVRGRHWVVSDLREGSPGADGSAPQHLVELASVEDDAYDQRSQVVWEIEPGARILEETTLPNPGLGEFDHPGRLDAFLDAVRWGAFTSANTKSIQSPFRSGIVIEDFQLEPVVRALSRPRINLLLADDVGLGKTIEAGLVIQEMLLRHRARTVLIVCPASLCVKWQQEMQVRFGLEFRIVDAELVRHLRRERGLGANPWTHYPRLITSLQWMRMPRPLSLLRDALPSSPHTLPRAFDFLVIDEVHNVAPPGRGRYATDSQQTKVIREIAPYFEHRLYLSATPHNGYPESFSALLELLDPQRFARGLTVNKERLAEVMIRRLKSELREDAELRRPDGSPRFADRQVLPLPVEIPDTEREIYALLARYAQLCKSAVGEDAAGREASRFVTLLLKKRFYSSPRAFASTLAVHRETLSKKRARKPSRRTAQAMFDLAGAEGAKEDEQQEATEEALAIASVALGGVDDEQGSILDQLEHWAQANRDRADAKAAAIIALVESVCCPTEKNAKRTWNDERIIVFTEYRDTQQYLYDLMTARLGGTESSARIGLLYGGMDDQKRERLKAEFQAHPSESPVRILLATDAASEGIDLQRHCHRLIHADLPFNPARIEQRNGRIDRHGQRAPVVEVYHTVDAAMRDVDDDSIGGEWEFLLRLMQKFQKQREDLMNVMPIFTSALEERMLGKAVALDRVGAAPKQREAAKLLRLERRIREEVAKLAARMRESREELGITPDAVARVVQQGLELVNQPPLVPTTLKRRGGAEVAVFRAPDFTGSWARTILDLPDPLNDVRRPITFDHAAADDAGDVVLAHLGHPLVSQAMRVLRSRIWSSSGASGLSRVTARVVPDAALGELVVLGHARVVVTGSAGHRLHEEVILTGGRIANGRYSREGYGPQRLAAVRAAVTKQPVPMHVREALASAWPTFRGDVQGTMGATAGALDLSLAEKIVQRRDEDLAAVRETLLQLEQMIKTQLAELDPQEAQLRLQLETEDERQQFDDDIRALRRRLEEIPAELPREEAAIRARYDLRGLRMFPVAIEFLVPERLCQEGLADVLRTRGGRSA